MSSWATISLGSLASFRNGLNYTQEASHRGGLPIIGVKDFQQRVTLETHDLEELDGNIVDCGDTVVHQGDILFVRSNGNRELIGRSLFVLEEPSRLTTYSGFSIRLRFHDRRVEPRFFAYLFRGSVIRQTLSSQGGGTNISNLNQQILANLRVPLPPIPAQQRIASILSAYDDLIEVNRRRIAVLEEMARRLFAEWFVHFRFPGHEGQKNIETEKGRIPDGWTAQPLEALTSYIARGIAPTYDPKATGLVISQKCIRGGRLSLSVARRQSKIIPPLKLVRIGDILVNSTGTGTLGRIAQVEEILPGTTVDGHVTIIRPKPEIDRDFLGAAVSRLQALFESMAVGATNQVELNRSRIMVVEIVSPPADLTRRFGSIVRPMLALSFKLERQIDSLASSRDLLLPRLTSGELSVAIAERELEAAD